MDRTIKIFSIESDFEGVQLTGTCRWVGDMMQVEMTAPMKLEKEIQGGPLTYTYKKDRK